MVKPGSYELNSHGTIWRSNTVLFPLKLPMKNWSDFLSYAQRSQKFGTNKGFDSNNGISVKGDSDVGDIVMLVTL